MSIECVLIIDDEPDIRSVLEMTISTLTGWHVLTASSGIEGVQRARNHVPDVILLDVMMPDMDGPETFRVLRSIEQTRDIPVIFMTAKARFVGGKTIVKPFDPLTLVDQITDLLRETEPLATSPIDTGVEAQLRSLWNRHRGETLEKVELVCMAAQLWHDGKLDDQLRELARSHAHALAGTAGLFGFSAAASLSQQIEVAFDDLPPPADLDLIDLTTRLLDDFQKVAS